MQRQQPQPGLLACLPAAARAGLRESAFLQPRRGTGEERQERSLSGHGVALWGGERGHLVKKGAAREPGVVSCRGFAICSLLASAHYRRAPLVRGCEVNKRREQRCPSRVPSPSPPAGECDKLAPGEGTQSDAIRCAETRGDPVTGMGLEQKRFSLQDQFLSIFPAVHVRVCACTRAKASVPAGERCRAPAGLSSEELRCSETLVFPKTGRAG